MLRRRYLLPLVAFAALGLTVPATANAAPQHESHHAFPTSFPLPNGFLPEGIAIGPGANAYFGSRADGDVYRVDLRTGRGKVFSQGPGTPSIGLKSDGKRWLFIAGGPAGNGRVVDIRSGKIVASYQFTSETATFVNDVVLTRDAAWFTDSQQAVLYKVPLRHGKLPKQSDVETLPLSGDYVHTEGFNANGIAQTPDRQASADRAVQHRAAAPRQFAYRRRPDRRPRRGERVGRRRAAGARPDPVRGAEPAQPGRGLQAGQVRARGEAGQEPHRRPLRHPDHGRGLRQAALPAERALQHAADA